MSEKRRIVDCEKLPLWKRPFAGIPHLRDPNEETEDFPGFVVHDGRVTGSVTLGYSRLPVWCLIADVVARGWEHVQADRGDDMHVSRQQFVDFLYYLTEARGDFGRLLCVLADVERRAARAELRTDGLTFAWWYHPKMKARVRAALQRCIDSLDAPPPELEPLKLEVTEIKY